MRSLPCILSLLLLVSCFQVKKDNKPVPGPAGYNLGEPVKIIMDEDLDEISGIRIDEASGQFIAVNDEEGKLYRVNREGKIQGKPFKFAKKGDFEEIDTDGTYWYAVKSTGEVTRIRNAFTDSFTTRVYPFPETGVEFETISVDPQSKKVFVLTKTPKALVNGKVAAYVLDTASGSFSFAPEYAPDSAALTTVSGNPKLMFKPTSAAFHPITGELYVISVNDRILVVMKNGDMKQVYTLPKSGFRQPEGICFASNGDMYISNEAQDANANILQFRYAPPAAPKP